MGLSENSVPLHPMVLLIIIPTKWLFHWEYTPFSDIPIFMVTGGYTHSSSTNIVLVFMANNIILPAHIRHIPFYTHSHQPGAIFTPAPPRSCSPRHQRPHRVPVPRCPRPSRCPRIRLRCAGGRPA